MASCRGSLTETPSLASLWPAMETGNLSCFGAVELARRGGCDHRKLRELIELGLVNKAIGKGRAAKYFEGHVEQLRAVLHALDEHDLSKPELRWVLDPDTPHRLRRQARAAEHLSGPTDSPGRVENVALDIGLQLSLTGSMPKHLEASARRVLASIAGVLRAEADRVEALRKNLTTAARLW